MIEDLLYKRLEHRGHAVKAENGSLYRIRFVVAGQTLSYTIR